MKLEKNLNEIKKLFSEMNFENTTENRKKVIREKLILENLGLVESLAYKYSKYSKIDIDELKQYGVEGLISAIDHFDISKGFEFISYASKAIKMKMFCGKAELEGFKRGKFYSDYNIAKKIVESNSLSEIDLYNKAIKIANLLAKTGKISINNVEETINRILINTPDNINDIIEEQENYDNIHKSKYEGELITDIPTIIENKIIHETVCELIKTPLKKEETEIIKLRFGLDDDKPKTLEEVSNNLGISKGKVRNIESKALKKIYKYAKK